MVCPIIDVISDDTFEYMAGSDMTYGGFNWKLNFRWYPVPQREMERRKGDRTLPVRSVPLCSHRIPPQFPKSRCRIAVRMAGKAQSCRVLAAAASGSELANPIPSFPSVQEFQIFLLVQLPLLICCERIFIPGFWEFKADIPKDFGAFLSVEPQ